MSITYPINIPGPIYPSTADLKQYDGIGEFMSPFTGQAEQQSFLDQHWELDLEWPEMTWTQFAALSAFSASMHGKLGSFLWGPPLAAGPRGLGMSAGTPLCAGTDLPGSNLLTTAGWTPSTSGLLLPGDYLQVGGGIRIIDGIPTIASPVRLYQYIQSAGSLTSDGGGNAVIDIFPCLREAPLGGATISLMNPQGTFRLAENRRSAPAKSTKTFTFALKCREAI
jgi:hypothetical protein